MWASTDQDRRIRSAHTGFVAVAFMSCLTALAGCSVHPSPAEPTPVYAEGLPSDAQPVPVQKLSIAEPEPKLMGTQEVDPAEGHGSTEPAAQEMDPAEHEGEPATQNAPATDKTETAAPPTPPAGENIGQPASTSKPPTTATSTQPPRPAAASESAGAGDTSKPKQ